MTPPAATVASSRKNGGRRSAARRRRGVLALGVVAVAAIVAVLVAPLFQKAIRELALPLQPALVLTCSYDPLCDEGIAYAQRLEREGVRVMHVHYSDQTHGFVGQGKIIRAGHGLSLRTGTTGQLPCH